MDRSHSKSDDPTCSHTKTLCRSYNIVDCHVFGSRSRHGHRLCGFPLSVICLHMDSNRAGVKYSFREMSLFLTEAPHCFKPNMRFCRSVAVPVPSQSTTQRRRRSTLNMNKQDLNKVISRSQNQNSKEGQSVSQSVSLGWNYISRFPLSAKTTQPSAVLQPEAERYHFQETSIHAFSTPAKPVQGLHCAGAYPSMH